MHIGWRRPCRSDRHHAPGRSIPGFRHSPLTTDHNTALVAAAVVDALNADEDISAVFTASITGAGDDTILLTANEYAANDTTVALAFTVGITGVTVGSSTNGTTGGR